MHGFKLRACLFAPFFRPLGSRAQLAGRRYDGLRRVACSAAAWQGLVQGAAAQLRRTHRRRHGGARRARRAVRATYIGYTVKSKGAVQPAFRIRLGPVCGN